MKAGVIKKRRKRALYTGLYGGRVTQYQRRLVMRWARKVGVYA